MDGFTRLPIEYGNYAINTDGVVINYITGKVLKENINGFYKRVCLVPGIYRVHQLMAITFLNHKPQGMSIVVDHINGDKLDNRLENLQLITQKENIRKYYNKKRGLTSPLA